ncbi:MAG: phosphomannomutase/phosphoglucomutase [Deltaproteobacteria bacterium]|nr:phosphomannomutase/phosphoglucomutase [Deltaproteobacteria bacterium]
MNPAIFREYDIRGIADQDFDTSFAHALGQAYGTYVRTQGKKRIAVGRDCRLTSDKYAEALRRGLRSTGINVVDIGTCPTPLMYFSLFHYDLDGGLQVTGSHNPADHNGFKMCIGKFTIHGEEIQELRKLIESGRFAAGQGTEEQLPIIAPYQDFLIKQFGQLSRKINVVIDAGNSTAGPVAPRIFQAMGCQLTALFCDLDGRFPNHHPDPTIPENLTQLIATVKETGAEIGVAYDGDADRVGLVDRHGRIVWGDEMMVLFARDILRHHPGATIVSEVKCSQRLFDDVAKQGGNPIMWKVGHSLLKAKMRETGAKLGGEMSGHIFFADRYFGYDDAIYASCRMLEILATSGKELTELLADLPPSFTTPEIRVDCSDDQKFHIAEKVRDHFRGKYEIVDVDGVRVKFPDGWGLVRASNTQPVLVLRFEAKTQAQLAEYRTLVEQVVEKVKRELGV